MYKRYLIYPLLLLITCCAYYNTLFNAEENYKNGMKKLESSKDGKVTSDIQKDFNSTIDKCWKLINIYSDSSRYADDALLLIGKSHFHIEEYVKSERFLRQFILRYPNSNLLPEAYLWLARSLIKMHEEAEALDFLNEIFTLNVGDDIASLAYFALGELYREQKEYDNTIDNFTKCLDIADDNLAAQAQFAIGDIYFQQGDYERAVLAFSAVRDFDAPLKIEFDALIFKADSYTLQNKFDLAVETLQLMLRESQFTDYFSVIEAKIGECYYQQKDYDFAGRQYQYVLETYPKTEGSAQAAFGFAKIMQYHFGDMDSAKTLYQLVKNEYRQSELIEDAEKNVHTLQTYLKLKESITQDIEDLRTLERGDEIELDEVQEDETEVIEDTLITAPETEVDTLTRGRERRQITRSKPKPPKPERKIRSMEEIKESLEKNRYALAEFFLLNIQNYDSARVAYTNFIATTQDTLLKPKAYYTLYYIYSFQLKDPVTADSLEKIILENYPESQYADYIKEKKGLVTFETDTGMDPYHRLFLQAESLLDQEEYQNALEILNQIALEDSGSAWAKKSRYVTAWIYEKKLVDIPKAIAAYSVIVKEYPDSELAKIAANKIKIPVIEEGAKEDIQSAEDSTRTKEQDPSEEQQKEEQQLPPEKEKR